MIQQKLERMYVAKRFVWILFRKQCVSLKKKHKCHFLCDLCIKARRGQKLDESGEPFAIA